MTGYLPAGITQNALDTVIKDAALDMEWDCGANAGLLTAPRKSDEEQDVEAATKPLAAVPEHSSDFRRSA